MSTFWTRERVDDEGPGPCRRRAEDYHDTDTGPRRTYLATRSIPQRYHSPSKPEGTRDTCPENHPDRPVFLSFFSFNQSLTIWCLGYPPSKLHHPLSSTTLVPVVCPRGLPPLYAGRTGSPDGPQELGRTQSLTTGRRVLCP